VSCLAFLSLHTFPFALRLLAGVMILLGSEKAFDLPWGQVINHFIAPAFVNYFAFKL